MKDREREYFVEKGSDRDTGREGQREGFGIHQL